MMIKSNKVLTTLCTLSMLILLALQGYWIFKQYKNGLSEFEKEVNRAFEDGIKNEFSARADKIEEILYHAVLDTSKFQLDSRYDAERERVIYQLQSKKDTSDRFDSSISFADFNREIKDDGVTKQQVARKFVQHLRRHDIENQIVYYRTQELGEFMEQLRDSLEFDTIQLRKHIDKQLFSRDIQASYNFYLREVDSTLYNSQISEELLNAYPIITRSFPTYHQNKTDKFVRAIFKDPTIYVLSNMWMFLIASVCLVLLLFYCLYTMLSSLKSAKTNARIKDDFISNITHEFKTPLAVAMVAIESISQDEIANDSEKRKRYLSHAKHQLEYINELTDKILKISVYDNMVEQTNKIPLFVEQVITRQIEIKQQLHTKVKFRFRTDIGNTFIVADQLQFEHALNNVIDNAIKYGGENVDIETNVSKEDNFLIISITDNGPGITSSDLPYIFDKFYRGSSSKSTRGYGLGLNYVKQILALHDGWVSAKSSKDGTTIKMGWKIK